MARRGSQLTPTPRRRPPSDLMNQFEIETTGVLVSFRATVDDATFAGCVDVSALETVGMVVGGDRARIAVSRHAHPMEPLAEVPIELTDGVTRLYFAILAEMQSQRAPKEVD